MATSQFMLPLPDTIAPPLQERRHEGVLLAFWAGFWLLMLAVAVRDYTQSGGREWWKPVLWEGSAMLYATLLLILQRRHSARLDAIIDQPWRWFAGQLKWFPLAGAVMIALYYATRHGVYVLLGSHYEHEPWAQVFAYEGAKFLLFGGLWLGVIFSLDSHAHWQAQRQRLLVLQRSLSEARLAQLSAQLRPHFFFNTLNTISALMHLDVARADRLLSNLGELLRATLQSTPQGLHPLRRELHLLALYAQVMAERFADRVSIEWDVERAPPDAMVPAMLLQPLVENAFKHGVERVTTATRIRIVARREGETLYLLVANTEVNSADLTGDGIGVPNCRARLEELFGARASLALTVADGEFLASVRLPFSTEVT